MTTSSPRLELVHDNKSEGKDKCLSQKEKISKIPQFITKIKLKMLNYNVGDTSHEKGRQKIAVSPMEKDFFSSKTRCPSYMARDELLTSQLLVTVDTGGVCADDLSL